MYHAVACLIKLLASSDLYCSFLRFCSIQPPSVEKHSKTVVRYLDVDWLVAFRRAILNVMSSPWEEEAAPLRHTLLVGITLRSICWGWPALESLVLSSTNTPYPMLLSIDVPSNHGVNGKTSIDRMSTQHQSNYTREDSSWCTVANSVI